MKITKLINITLIIIYVILTIILLLTTVIHISLYIFLIKKWKLFKLRLKLLSINLPKAIKKQLYTNYKDYLNQNFNIRKVLTNYLKITKRAK